MAAADDPHVMAQPPTRQERHLVDIARPSGYTVRYYVAACTCGHDFVAATKDSVWAQLAAHCVDAPGGLRDILRESGIVDIGPVEVFETGGPDDHD